MMNTQTDRLILRKVKQEDAKEIFNILSDKETTNYLNMSMHQTIEDTKKMIEEYLQGYKNKTKYPFSILDKKTKKLIGVFLIKLDIFDEDCFEFTIYLKKEFWNQGIYTEVLKKQIPFVFETIKTQNFRGFVMEKNEASSRVLEKCHFKLEKIFEVEGIEGKIKSYLMTKEDYKALNENKG